MGKLGSRRGKGGPKTTRTTISVQTVLYKQMAKVKGSVNWSNVASEAFLKVVEEHKKMAKRACTAFEKPRRSSL